MSLAEDADAFCAQLQRRQIQGSLATAKRTAVFLRLLITSRRHSDAQALLDDVRAWGTRVQAAKPFSACCDAAMQSLACPASDWLNCTPDASALVPSPSVRAAMQPSACQAVTCGAALTPLHSCAELVIGNIVRRVLHIIREESQQVR